MKIIVDATSLKASWTTDGPPQRPRTVFSTTLQEPWNPKRNFKGKAASALRLIASSCIASVSREEGPATKTVFVYVAETKPKTKSKSTRQSKSQTIATLAFSRTSQPSYQCANAHAKSLSARRSTASVSVRD